MFKKFNKTQIIIFISTIIFIFLIFGIIFCIDKFNNNDVKDTGTLIAKENNTKELEINKVNNTKLKDEEVTEENETTFTIEVETTTSKPTIESQTQPTTVITTQPQTYIYTEPQTEAPKPTETQTQPPTQTSTQAETQQQYYDPYTGQPISKEEYESIWNEINNPKPAEPVTQAENVYVLNDDGTINFKESKIYNQGNNDSEQSVFLRLLYKSKEVKELLGEELYSYITAYSEHWDSLSSPKPTFFACINNEYWLAMTFDENWNIKKGMGEGMVILYDPKNLPIKENW